VPVTAVVGSPEARGETRLRLASRGVPIAQAQAGHVLATLVNDDGWLLMPDDAGLPETLR